MDKIVLIDGHSILNRAFYGVPELTNSEGIHTNAVYGFLNIMFKILDEEQASHLAVAFDVHEPTFRHEMYEAYKGTRKAMPNELVEQVPLIQEVLTKMGVRIVTKPGFEADDILGTLAKRCVAEGMEVSIVSGDRDLLQLADDRVKIRIPKTSKGTTEIKDYYPKDVFEAYQVTPSQFIDVKALMGDSSDNIPGVPSIGEKTAVSLISTYGSIENAYEHVEEIKPPRAKNALKEHYDMAQMSKVLAAICTDCDIDFQMDEAKIGDMNTPEAYQIMKRLEFKSMMGRFDVEQVGDTAIEDNFVTLNDFGEVDALLKEAENQDCIGLQLITWKGQVAALALGMGDKAYCLPVQGFVTADYLMDKASRLCASVQQVSVLNLKEQLPYLNTEEPEHMFDAGVAGYLLNPLKDTYDYDDLARDYMGLTVPSKMDLLGKVSVGAALEAEEKKAELVCCYMAYVASQSISVLKKKLEETDMLKLFQEIEMPLIFSLYHMEETGIQAEREALRVYGEKLSVGIDELEQQIYDATGEKFNINSPKQLGEILFDKLKLPFAKKTKTGYSTAADVLDKLKPDYPVVGMILEYRQLTKLKSTYADGLAVYIGEDKRIHGTFNQTITATGRISSTEPNLQNIPVRMELGREIRKVFVPKEGCVFVDADYSQIELRVLAHMSGDERLIEAYKQAEDIHAITASQVFHTPLAAVTPLQRRNAKAVNFGIVYGISAFGLSEGLSITRAEAVEYINKYFETYPGVKAFLDGLVNEAKEKGYVTTMFGRRRPVPELKSANFMQRSFGERVAMNSPIQGTAADIIKIAMIRVDQRLRREKLKSRLVLQVHDELLIETYDAELEQVKAILSEEMHNAAHLAVPLEIDMKTGHSWYETK